MYFVGVARLGEPLGHPSAGTVCRKARVGVIVNGSNIPGLTTAGSYGDNRTFWDVQRADTVGAVTGAHGSYRPIVIEVDDPPATVARRAPSWRRDG
jgi:hypothetical protein